MHRLRILSALLVLVASVSTLPADTLLMVRTTSEGMPGIPAQDETRTVWIGEERIREDGADQSVIVDLGQSKLFVLKHRSKSYHVLDLPIDLTQLVPEEQLQELRAQADRMAMEVAVTPTEETREIRSLLSKKYDLTMSNPMGLQMTIELWTTTALEIDIEAYKRMTLQMAEVQAMGSDWVKKILEIEGFPVLREMTVAMGEYEMVTREELFSVETREAPEGNYLPPPDYEPEPLDFGGEPAP
jgi:hypothetical protein